jgi:uncharacterized repeat protein (TIGR03803 family)
LVEVNGLLYGTTSGRSYWSCGNGTIFSITPDGSFKTLYTFGGGLKGDRPAGGLTSIARKLFGLAQDGAHLSGIVYSINP